MSRKSFSSLLLTAAFSLLAATAAFGQTSPVGGEVKLQKPDGTIVPVEGAVIDAYRIDIDSGKMPEVKTNKRGEFRYVGFPLGQKFVLAVSGPGIGPRIQPDVKAGMDKIVFVVNEGDGRRLSEAEAREAAKFADTAPAPGKGPTAAQAEASKKEREELEKKNAAIMASNKKAEDANKIVNASFKAGDAAFKAGNFDAAIAEFDKGIEADPDFEGSAPILLNYKGVALQKRAMAAYNATAGDAAARLAVGPKVKPDLDAAIATFKRGIDVLNKGGASAPAAEQAKYAGYRLNLVSNLLEAHGLAAGVAPDPSRDAQVSGALEQYLAVEEPDAAKRKSLLLTFAGNLNGAGMLNEAVTAYRKVLEMEPTNPDALAGLGLALYSIGYDDASKKDMLQEGLNYMQKFVETAPDSHKLKQSTRDIIDQLKTEKNLAPQKVAPARRKG